MTLFPVFHPPCLFVFSVVIFGGYLFGIFHDLISNCNVFRVLRGTLSLSLKLMLL